MCAEAGNFSIHNPFTIIKKNNNVIDYYHFASDWQDKKINQVYLANLDLLNLFIEHFTANIKQSKLLSKAYDFTFNLNNGNESNLKFEEDSNCDRAEFIRSINPKTSRLQIANKLLSKRQSEILKLVVQGKTIKEISKILNLSPRTVGHYFDTIKDKVNASSRSELIAKAINSKSVNLFGDFLK